MTPEVVDGLARARALLDVGRWEAAAQEAGALTVASPGDARPWTLLVEAYLDGGLEREAVHAARTAVALQPHDVSALIWLSQALRGVDGPAAVQAARAASEIAPGSWAAHAQLALCLADVGRKGPARREADAAVRAAPDRSGAHVVRAQVLLAGSAVRRARRSALTALRVDPQDPDAMTVLGFAELAAMRVRRAARLVLAAGAHGTRPADLGRLVGVVVDRWIEAVLVWLGLTMALTAIVGLVVLVETPGPAWPPLVLPSLWLVWTLAAAGTLTRALRGELGTLLRRRVRERTSSKLLGGVVALATLATVLTAVAPTPQVRVVGVVLCVAVVAALLVAAVRAVVAVQGKRVVVVVGVVVLVGIANALGRQVS